jgi:hypothetical protein
VKPNGVVRVALPLFHARLFTMTDIAIVGCDLDADDAFGPVVVGCRQGFDFTLLFEQAILSTLPAALAIVAAIVSIPLLWKQSVKIAPGGRRRPPLAITLVRQTRGFLSAQQLPL